jgi:hypothetical protein
MTSGPPTVTWDEVIDAAARAFNIWGNQPELGWAKRAWKIIEDCKLTTYDNEYDRCRVLFRLLALGGIYRGFCDVAWDGCSELEYSSGRSQ